MKEKKASYSPELSQLCGTVKGLIKNRNYDECLCLISDAMRNYPHAPHPHNLMGILLETKGDQLTAMKHFRAAWALDPTYLPCRINLDRYGSFFSQGPCAYDEQDCPSEGKRLNCKVQYDEAGIGHIERQE